MLVVVTSISLCVHIYSLGYMKGDVRFTWFYAVLSLFTERDARASSSPNNLFQLLVGWEIMGVCSYLLIGHWWEDHVELQRRDQGVHHHAGRRRPVHVRDLRARSPSPGSRPRTSRRSATWSSNGGASVALVSAAALLLFGGTIGKSAQFPLHVWLPDAMAGPTPVSALIHAATMVAAGVYLGGPAVRRLHRRRPGRAARSWRSSAAITMLGAALMAFVQDDIKRVLAYSTISPARVHGRRAVAWGRPVAPAAFFHLFTHAFFKALLFLGAGVGDPRGPHEQHERDGRPAEEACRSRSGRS